MMENRYNNQMAALPFMKKRGWNMGFFSTAMNPDIYHGFGKKPPFFEGWYFKLVDASEEHRYAVIPGIFKSNDDSESHAFVQVLDGATGKSIFHTYPENEFHSERDRFDIQIGPNHFSANEITLDIEDPELTMSGSLRFDTPRPWPVSLLSPGIMGWYAWVPYMECYHGVVSLDHGIQGELTVQGTTIDFSNGRGYIEKDWGRAFPAAWVWFQSNHFMQPETSLTASIAIIPWLKQAFPGFIIGLWHNQHLYRFATYTGARVEELDITDQQVTWTVSDGNYRLEMLAIRSEGGLLQAPTPKGMGRRILETLSASVQVHLSQMEGQEKRTILNSTGRIAGLEAVGDLDRLVGMWASKRRSNNG
jgi:tocopherol cyclase